MSNENIRDKKKKSIKEIKLSNGSATAIEDRLVLSNKAGSTNLAVTRKDLKVLRKFLKAMRKAMKLEKPAKKAKKPTKGEKIFMLSGEMHEKAWS